MPFTPRDVKDVSKLVSLKLETYINKERPELYFDPSGRPVRTGHPMWQFDTFNRLFEQVTLDSTRRRGPKRTKPGSRVSRSVPSGAPSINPQVELDAFKAIPPGEIIDIVATANEIYNSHPIGRLQDVLAYKPTPSPRLSERSRTFVACNSSRPETKRQRPKPGQTSALKKTFIEKTKGNNSHQGDKNCTPDAIGDRTTDMHAGTSRPTHSPLRCQTPQNFNVHVGSCLRSEKYSTFCERNSHRRVTFSTDPETPRPNSTIKEVVASHKPNEKDVLKRRSTSEQTDSKEPTFGRRDFRRYSANSDKLLTVLLEGTRDKGDRQGRKQNLAEDSSTKGTVGTNSNTDRVDGQNSLADQDSYSGHQIAGMDRKDSQIDSEFFEHLYKV